LAFVATTVAPCWDDDKSTAMSLRFLLVPHRCCCIRTSIDLHQPYGTNSL